MRFSCALIAALFAHVAVVLVDTEQAVSSEDHSDSTEVKRDHGHHHGHHRRHHHKKGHGRHSGLKSGHSTKATAITTSKVVGNAGAARDTAVANVAANALASIALSAKANASASSAASAVERDILGRMRAIETEVTSSDKIMQPVAAAAGTSAPASGAQRGRVRVGGPLPPDFVEQFRHCAAQAAGCSVDDVQVIGTPQPATDVEDVYVIEFQAPANVVHLIEDQAADPDSKLASGNLRRYLVARDDSADATQAASLVAGDTQGSGAAQPASPSLDVDTQMPYGELEPFGREDTGQELTESSISQSNTMVDQLERAEVAEERRAVFRALTRLRGAAITSFDGIARSQTGNIDEYSQVHQWRRSHPLSHLADEESDVSKWAFPDAADF